MTIERVWMDDKYMTERNFLLGLPVVGGIGYEYKTAVLKNGNIRAFNTFQALHGYKIEDYHFSITFNPKTASTRITFRERTRADIREYIRERVSQQL